MTEDTGGHIAYVLGAAQAQARRADVAQVDIVTRAFEDRRLGAIHAMPREAVAPGLDILRLRTARSDYLDKDALEQEIPALRDAFLGLLRRMPLRPDILHAHFADAAQLAQAAEHAFGLPWIYSSHSLALDKLGGAQVLPGSGMARRIARERAAITGASAIIASSRDEAERQIVAYAAQAEGRTHRVAPGGTAARSRDTARARALIAPFLRAPDLPVILAVARPIRKKNLAGLVTAYAADPALRARANLVILAGQRQGLRGQGAEADGVFAELFDLIDRHDLWGHVALPRQHGAGDVAALYALAARGGVFVNPAQHEPFGLTLIEAAQADVPLVATRNGGPADILRSLGAGELTDPADPLDIADALRRTLDDPRRAARARAAGQRARRIYDWDRWAARVHGIQAALLRDRRQGGPVTHHRALRATRLLACDIDGTLTGDRTAAARFAGWHATREPGVRFAVATGRSVVEARRVLADWGLPEPDVFITSVGTEIWRRSAGDLLTLCPDFAAHVTQGWARADIAATIDELDVPQQPAWDQRRWKLSYFGTAQEAARIEQALAQAGLRARVVASHGRLIDVLPPQAGKAATIRFEAARHGLPDTACITAGDSGNDLDMLAGFANAIIPANASSEVAGVARAYRARAAHADGVLEGLGRFGLAAPSGFAVAAE
ncbi:HAD-IIB family hydrolase [Mesobaculum littorinae]|uniref:sucrose-phosphate synthase n=1 Tax=Mesobaculum littorinae TaxID=2486419 RepID=A0A438AN97_9RHOB|nr:HAD-IIB family hydrolase [Mesobaculum littorinae]